METRRLILRPYQQHDFAFLYHLVSDPAVMHFIGNGHTKSRKEAKDFLHWIFQMYQLGEEFGLRIMIRKSDHRPIGHAGLVPQTIDGKKELEIGYWIAHSYWGNGYATEIAEALKQFAIQYLDRNRLIALVQEGNYASANIARKLGMKVDKVITIDGRVVHLYAANFY
ncbi:GNAT family N-acetyltransferase [Gracilibacillus sp. YIM 98692]|uniref:GNAT family N-acetyltransferase n=1 Tax=Gracilibacillus sp. YIM 98692 TaxID=2663532 RepID=UPI001F08F93F|nr:GNAT family N-acetyltransferase [Gracilibacillus sp. YIM 98692]